MNMDGLPTVSGQNFLGFGFLLRRSDSHPDKQALPFRLLFQPERTLSIQPPTYSGHRYAAYDKAAQYRNDADVEWLCAPRDKNGCNGDSSDASGDAASNSL